MGDDSSIVLDVELDGDIVDSLLVDLTHSGQNKPEGLTVNADDELVLAGEPDVVRVYAP